MKLTSLIGLLAVAAAIGLPAADVAAQYYVPLRYDLRYTSPTYIPSINYGYAAPPRTDPYAFGSLQYGDLTLTGNVRGGRSFQGHVPYSNVGSQLATSLPSLALSNFNRDSIGIGDIGSGVEYGVPLPYFPGAGSVTSVYTAQLRFATQPPGARTPYALPNLNTSLPALSPQPPAGAFYVPPVPPPAEPEAGVRLPGLYVPQSALEWVKALSEGRVSTANKETGQLQDTGQMDMRIGMSQQPAGLPDARVGAKTSATSQTAPPGAAKGQKPEGMTPEESFEADQSALYWEIREAAAKPAEPAAAGTKPAPATPAAPDVKPKPEKSVPGAEQEPPLIPVPPDKYRVPGTYADYMKQADEAMKESNYAKADGLYAAAATQDPNRSAAFFGRVFALMADRQYMLASFIVERTIRAHPAWGKEVPAITAVYVKPGLYDRIVDDLKQELVRSPGNAETCLILGYVYLSAGQKELATFYLNHVVRLRGNQPGAERALLAALEPPAAK